MWFGNAQIYHYEGDFPTDFHDNLMENALKPCPPHARLTHGWLPVTAGQFSIEVSKGTLFSFGKEERLLPRGVINRALNERIQQLETSRGYAVKRAEKLQLKEDLEFELLPKAFCLQKQMLAFFDHNHKRLIINTASATQANQLIALLRKSVSSLQIMPEPYPEELATHFSQWITHPTKRPKNMQLASDCLLFSPDDEKKCFNCKGSELPSAEVLSLLSQGLIAKEISLIWNERIQFTLTDTFTFKRIKCLDYLNDDFHDLKQMEDKNAEFEAGFVLLSGEWRALLNDLLHPVTFTSPTEIPQLAIA